MAFVPPPGYQSYYNPPLPYVAPVPGGLWPGMAVSVQGVVKVQAERFHVNLAMGPHEDADIALHVNPRFGSGVSVLNSRRGGSWGDEQRRDLHPLCPGTPFEMIISVTPEGYRILVNGTFYEELPHRLPPEHVTAVTVDGDLELHSASVLGGVGACPPCVPDAPQVTPIYPDCNLPVRPPLMDPKLSPTGDGAAPDPAPARPLHCHHPGGLIPKKTIIIKGFVPHDAN
ncbi:galectin-7-like, partial [Ammospiza maritima maritima]